MSPSHALETCKLASHEQRPQDPWQSQFFHARDGAQGFHFHPGVWGIICFLLTVPSRAQKETGLLAMAWQVAGWTPRGLELSGSLLTLRESLVGPLCSLNVNPHSCQWLDKWLLSGLVTWGALAVTL